MSQAFNSGSNFLLTLAAARLTGARGVGLVTVAFTTYLLVLGFHRALVSEPLVATTASSSRELRAASARDAAAVTAVGGVLAALPIGLAAAFVGEPWRGVGLVLAISLPGLLLQDLCRSVLFRDGRGLHAAGLDLLWVVVMGLALAFVGSPSPERVLASWALGGGAGGLMGWWLPHAGRPRVAPALRWWRRELVPFGRWLALEGIVFHAGAWGATVLMAGFLGSEGLGGIRAVQSLFAPMSLVGPAIALPGLPAVARRLARDVGAARRYAWILAASAVALSGSYLSLGLAYPRLLSLVFGRSFEGFSFLIAPVGVGQVAAAGALGAVLLLKAGRCGPALLWLRAFQSVLALVLTAAAAPHGLRVLAWSQAAAAGLVTAAYAAAARLAVAPRPHKLGVAFGPGGAT